MSIRFLADENFDHKTFAGLTRRDPHVDIVAVQDVGLRQADDPTKRSGPTPSATSRCAETATAERTDPPWAACPHRADERALRTWGSVWCLPRGRRSLRIGARHGWIGGDHVVITSSVGHGGPSRSARSNRCPQRIPSGNWSSRSHRQAATIARTRCRHTSSNSVLTSG